MGAAAGELSGPDLRQGVKLEALPESEPFVGHADGEVVILVRKGSEVTSVGGGCSHYGGPLGEGLVVGETIRCPWHHACFSLRTGEATGAPALNPIPTWDVEVVGGRARVTGRRELDPLDPGGRRPTRAPGVVAIVGAGAAGSAATEQLRREGYDGRILLIDPDAAAPYDRPNLSKDYLAGTAAEEWIPLRPAGFYEEHGVERIMTAVDSIDPRGRTLRLRDGSAVSYEALLLATGASPVRLRVPGA
ncbi:MAG TPA: FAD-dependent oxidoreductase, partial [Longimicrobiales bacterium]